MNMSIDGEERFEVGHVGPHKENVKPKNEQILEDDLPSPRG